MELKSNLVYEVLKKKGLFYLHHANTTNTSKTFIENKALLSRKYIESKGLKQTPQKSDEIDKKYGIWDYIFLDAIHVSKYFRNYNYYGPVLFIFKIELLLNDSIPTVRISKKNPINWMDGDNDEDRYYQSVEEFDESFYAGNKYKDGGNHIIITCLNGKLTFDKLHGIHIDNPGISVRDTSDNKNKNYGQAIFDYFKKDLIKIGITKLDLKIINNQLLKFQYFFLHKLRRKEFNQLFNK